MNDDQKSKEVPLSWFGNILWKFTPLYIELIVLAICLRLIDLVEPFIFQVIIDRVLPFQREATLVVVMVIFGFISLFQIAFTVVSNLLGILVANQATREFGAQLFGHLFRLPLQHFRQWPVGEIIARISETDTIRNFLVGVTSGAFLDLVFLFIYIIVLLTLSPTLTALILLALPLQAALYFGFGPFLRNRLKIQFDAGAAHQAQMVENITGISAVKALGAEDTMLSRLNSSLDATLHASYRVNLLGLINSQLIFLIDRAITIGILFIGAGLVFKAELTLGQLIAFHLLSAKVAAPIANFAGLWESWQNVRIARRRLGDILNQKMEGFGTLPNIPKTIGSNLSFDRVCFSYENDTPILDKFTVKIPPNELTLLVGPSGSGKSTFGRLAAGIDKPSSGIVALDGQDISQFDPKGVRSIISYIPQEPYLFRGTINENIQLGISNLEESDIQWALKASASESMINSFHLGLETQVGERGSALSGGQRQRIAIARSLLSKPKILIMDEPTSALDDENQHILLQGIQSLTPETTVIVITHRPALFQDCSNVIKLGV